MEDYHYKAILNNLFRYLHGNALKSLKELSQEKTLINICMELNNKSFLFIYDCIKSNTKDNLNDIINKIISDLESVVAEKDIKIKCLIDTQKITNNDQNELIHLSQLLIVYSLLLAEKKLTYIQTVKTCFNHTLRKNIYLIVNYYMKPEITDLKLSEGDEENDDELDEMDSNDEKEFTKKKTSDPKIQLKQKQIIEVRNLEKEIEQKANDITNKIGGINAKIQASNELMEHKIQKLTKLSKSKVNTLEIKGGKKDEKNKNMSRRKISMNLIKEKEKAIERLENKINNIQSEYQNYKQKKEKEINDMKYKVSVLLDKVNILEKKKILLKDYNELKEKSNKYDDLIVKYQRLKKIVDEKWDLTEQQYLDIIAKKDEDILRLKEALILSERQSMMNGNYTMKTNNYLNLGNSLFNSGNDSLGDSLLNFTEIGIGTGVNNNNNKRININNNNNNLLLSTNLSDINLKDIKDEEDKK